MTVTEDEANGKWCPHSRVVHSNGPETMFTSANSFGDGARSIATKCIASECMAWRWINAPGPRPSGSPEEIHRGFCGLAGPVS